ncbi:MAG: FAD-dependent oxidoreductase [Chloroflexota bacterium]
MTVAKHSPVSFLEALADNIIVDPQKCIFCGKCADACILDNIRLQLAPCRQACPLHTNCQGYVQLIARGEDEKAMAVLGEGLPFPGIVGRVCSHPCESRCTRQEVDGQAVSIRELKRYLADNVPLPPLQAGAPRPERVAIVGGGPAGAMAAVELRKAGFGVTLYDRHERLGGMLAVGVPEFRLPVAVLDGEMAQLRQLGVDLRLGVEVSRDVQLDDIIAGHDAVLLATGAHVGRRLGVPGEDLAGVWEGLTFLRQSRSSAKPQLGRRVVVIGGGNTAVDCAQTAHRLGAEQVRLVCLEQRAEMPAFAWEVEDALEEGIVVENGWGPTGCTGTAQVKAVQLRRCLSVFDAQGRFAPVFDDSASKALAADTVVVAIGQGADLSYLQGSLTAQGNWLRADARTGQLAGKVFAAGDAASGPKTVIEALAAGREAAESIRRFLVGEDLAYDRDPFAGYETEFAVDRSGAQARERAVPARATSEARRTFAELQADLAPATARAEAERCLSCGEAYGKFRNCWFCLPCEIECPEEALHVDIPYLLR